MMKLIVIGVLCGTITGLGMGGGGFLIIFLTAFLHMEQHLSQATNLVFYIPTSIAALLVYLKNKKIDSTVGKKLLYSTIFGASFGAILTKHISANYLRKYFAVFILIVGMAELINTIRLFIKKKGSKEST